MTDYRLTLDHHGYDPGMARVVKGVVKSFMRLSYADEVYKIRVDEKRGTLEFHLRNPDDINVVSENVTRVKSLKGHKFDIETIG